MQAYLNKIHDEIENYMKFFKWNSNLAESSPSSEFNFEQSVKIKFLDLEIKFV